MYTSSIAQAFQGVVSRHYDCIAISSKEQRLTYKEVNEQSNRLAHALVNNGLLVGDCVGIYFNRGIDAIISILGVLKAGGAYVPMAPENPLDRNKYILANTNMSFVISNNQNKEIINKMARNIKVVTLDDGEDIADINIQISSDDRAYVLYTSGTTGQPKGVCVTHGNLLHFSEWVTKQFQISKEDKLLQFVNMGFDLSIMEIFPALINGSCLYIIDDMEKKSISDFIDVINREKISIITVPTVFFHHISLFAKDNNISRLSSVRIISICGEQLITERVNAFFEQFGHTMDVYNLYGPTETTVAVSYYKVPKSFDKSSPSIPIGKPISNTTLYVVNEKSMLCKTGEVGELWIASHNISLGYLNKPEETSKVFIDNPFETNKYNGKVYKSGDVVRILADGNLEFISRKDTQIKIRGHRIELAEIEHALCGIENINDAVVIKEGEDKLKAFYTSKSKINITHIINILKKKLPSYMIPELYRRLETLPFTQNGKVDRKKLEKIDAYPITDETTDIVYPRNEVERIFVEEWKKILKIKNISVTDNFFEIGGHSLKVLEALVSLRAIYPQITLKDFYEYPTIEKIANYITNIKTQHHVLNDPVKSFIYLNEKPYIYKERKQRNRKKILLTGSTGFLGSYILRDLIEQNYEVYVLIRGNNPDKRLQEKYHFYFKKTLPSHSIHILNGDITKKYLGLDYQIFYELSNKIDAIIHSAADVRFHGNFKKFNVNNIEGTKNMLQLLELNSNIEFHHISTVGLLEDLAVEGLWDAFNNDTRKTMDIQNNTYTKTKLAAENVVLDQLHNREVFIYRIGNLVGSMESGQFQENIRDNALYGWIRSMILLNKAIDVDWQVDLTPVDFASKVIVNALSTDTNRRIFHVCHYDPIPHKKMVEYIKNMGYKIDFLSVKEFEEYLFDEEAKNPEGVELVIIKLDRNNLRNSPYIFDSKQTLKDLHLEEYVPKLDEKFIHRLLQYGQSIGYF
ncbi:amino acid adenylation domain-containing protein [Bacillus toyonensis]|uniref:amino acid adenylation domain-containing protein n=1 Tax=Bacillus toyonensis TaxID=155322 RepID=UPI000BF92DFC|nr:amino acid adenylation domain-containing protein [Bacillus toyonensis]PFY41743.1 thioester reductase [Bacillus toyonensis]PFY82313.1 thioester reductase [Bacillus toyonensis]PHA34049.1 thioester reductase [Bacillus toyonensis]